MSIPTKGLILVACPLLVQITFLAIFVGLREKLAADRQWSQHSEEVLAQTWDTRSFYNTALNRTLIYVLSEDAVQAYELEQYLTSATHGLDGLLKMVQDNPRAVADIEAIKLDYSEFEKRVRRIMSLAAAARDSQDIDRAKKVSDLSELLKDTANFGKEIKSKLDAFLAIEREISNSRTRSFDRRMNAIVVLFGIAACSMIVGAWGLYLFFREAFLKRFQAVLKNLERVGSRESLAPALPGTDELAQIDASIHELAGRLSEKEEEAELFLYSVSHDLRSPLVNIHGFGEELRQGLNDIKGTLSSDAEPMAKQQKVLSIIDKDLSESLRFIKAGTERMANIIESLLKLSRAWSNQYREDKVDLQEVCQKVVDSLAGSIEDKSANIEMKSLPCVKGDCSSLEQVIQNLLTNALKFSRLDRAPLIEIGSELHEGEKAQIYVRDNGLGIPIDALPKLFTGFRRFHPTAAPGDGIGLAVSRRVIQRHRGEIWCETETGDASGTTFYFTLPLWRESHADHTG